MKKVLLVLAFMFLLVSCNNYTYEIQEGTYTSDSENTIMRYADTTFSKVQIRLIKLDYRMAFDSPIYYRPDYRFFAIYTTLYAGDEEINVVKTYYADEADYKKKDGYKVGVYIDWGEYTTTFYWDLNFRAPNNKENKKGILAVIELRESKNSYYEESKIDDGLIEFKANLYLS